MDNNPSFEDKMIQKFIDWNDLKTGQYLPFLKWHEDRERGIEYCDIEIVGKPMPFTNKFGREQIKVEVAQIIANSICNEHDYLASGPQLFGKIAGYVNSGIKQLHIERSGKGLNTKHVVSVFKMQEKLDIQPIEIKKTKQKTK